MQYINERTNLAKGMIYRYEYAIDHGYSDIYDAYERPSRYKVSAWNDCKELCKSLNGFNLRIASRNTCKFTVTFGYFDPVDGDLRVAYITRDYDRCTSYVGNYYREV